MSAVQRIHDALHLLDGWHEFLHYSSVGGEDRPPLREAPDRDVTHGGNRRLESAGSRGRDTCPVSKSVAEKKKETVGEGLLLLTKKGQRHRRNTL